MSFSVVISPSVSPFVVLSKCLSTAGLLSQSQLHQSPVSQHCLFPPPTMRTRGWTLRGARSTMIHYTKEYHLNYTSCTQESLSTQKHYCNYQICKHIQIITHTSTYARAHAHACTHTHSHTHTSIRICDPRHTYTDTCVHMHIQIYPHAHGASAMWIRYQLCYKWNTTPIIKILQLKTDGYLGKTAVKGKPVNEGQR